MLNSSSYQDRFSWWVDILFLTVFLTIVSFVLLGSRPLFVPDEGRYAEIAREMAVSGDFITPYLNGIKYFEKPALFYWLSAFSIKIGGLNLWSVRSVNAILGVLGSIATYFVARKLYDRKTGLIAAFILSSSALYFIMSHMVSLDLPVSVFLALSLYAFLLATKEAHYQTQRYYLLAAFAFSACAVLTKGLIGIVFPIIIVGTWIIIFNEWRMMRHWLSCFIIFTCIVAPWHILVALRNPEFSYFYFVEQHVLRYSTLSVGHYQPFWFFIPCLILGFFPWIIFLPQTISTCLPKNWSARLKFKNELFFLIWMISIFLFFSFSKSKLIPYILPVFPPLAILTARYVTYELKGYFGKIFNILFLILFSLLIVYSLCDYVNHVELPNNLLAKFYLGTASIILMIGVLIFGIVYKYNEIKSIYILFLTQICFLICIFAAFPSADTRTILPLAKILKPILKVNDDVITYNQYYQDLPFYLERSVSILNWKNELSFGLQHQKSIDWMLNDNEFWKRFHSQKRVFILIGEEEYHQLKSLHQEEHFFILGKTIHTILISNQNGQP